MWNINRRIEEFVTVEQPKVNSSTSLKNIKCKFQHKKISNILHESVDGFLMTILLTGIVN